VRSTCLPPSEAVPERIPPARAALCALAFGLACAGASPPPPAPAPEEAPPPAELRVALVFGAEADHDLYVTDPFEETVYFANTPSRASGGALDRDQRCDAPAPRVERVRFARPAPGRYRVGVDHPERCTGGGGRTAFRLVVEWKGERIERRGEIELGEFQPAVLELEL
jgi:hypothetical protein